MGCPDLLCDLAWGGARVSSPVQAMQTTTASSPDPLSEAAPNAVCKPQTHKEENPKQPCRSPIWDSLPFHCSQLEAMWFVTAQQSSAARVEHARATTTGLHQNIQQFPACREGEGNLRICLLKADQV